MNGPLPVWEWRARFLDSPTGDPLARLVGLVLSHKANVEDSRRAYPGMAYLVKATGLDKRTIRDRLTALEGEGWIVRVEDGGSMKGGRRRAREWFLTIPEHARLGTPDVPSQEDASGRIAPESGDRLGTSRAPDQVHPVHGPGTPDVPPPLPKTPTDATPSVAATCANCAGQLDDGNYCEPCRSVTAPPLPPLARRRQQVVANGWSSR